MSLSTTTASRTTLAAPFQLEESRTKNGTLTLTGYAAVYDSLSEDIGFVERLARNCFAPALKRRDLDVRLLVNHDGLPLARTTNGTLRLSEDSRGLRVEADLADTQAARDLKVLLI